MISSCFTPSVDFRNNIHTMCVKCVIETFTYPQISLDNFPLSQTTEEGDAEAISNVTFEAIVPGYCGKFCVIQFSHLVKHVSYS